MIEFVGSGTKRIYTYEGKKYQLNELANHEHCVVSKQTLSGRILSATKKDGTFKTRWCTMKQCLSTPVVTSGNTLNHKKWEKNFLDVISSAKEDEFTKLHMIMPVCDLKHRVMGNR